jgi:hypothetical protein
VLPNGGVVEHTLNDHLIQVNMPFNPTFASMLHEFRAAQGPQPQELMPSYKQDNEGESEIEIDDHDVLDNYYPSGSKAGDLSDIEDKIPLAENEDEDEDEAMEGMVVQEGWLVQGAHYLNNPKQGVQTTRPSTPVPTHRILDKQQDKDIEVTICCGKHFPSGLVNVSGENHDDPFEIAAISRGTTREIGPTS